MLPVAPISKSRIFFGWVKEFFWGLLYLLHILPGIFIRFKIKPGLKNKPPIILVSDTFIFPLFYLRLRKMLLDAGYPVAIISTGHAFQPLIQHARNMSGKLAELGVTKGILIGHGMGSLPALAMPDVGRKRINHLISLGSPYHGSKNYTYLKFIPSFRDMIFGSDYLLMHRMNALLFASFAPFIAWQDESIIPFNLAMFGQGRDMILDNVGHLNLVLSRENIQTYIEYLDSMYPDLPARASAALPEVTGQTVPGKKVAKKTTRKTVRKIQKKTAKKATKKKTRK